MSAPRHIRRRLAAILTALHRRGVRHLNIPSDPALAAALRQAWPLPQAAMLPATRGENQGPALAERSAAASPSAAAASPSAAADKLAALQAQYRECMACALGKSRNRIVFGVGHPQARLMFIGEGPGADEDAQGEPFVGRAGALLTGMIQALGLTREDVYITNVVKCRPPGNRNPQPPEVAACYPLLLGQIAAIDPTIIITLGNVPLQALRPGAKGITRERGRRFAFQQWSVLPTFHPSYLLRRSNAIPDSWRDFKQAWQFLLKPIPLKE